MQEELRDAMRAPASSDCTISKQKMSPYIAFIHASPPIKSTPYCNPESGHRSLGTAFWALQSGHRSLDRTTAQRSPFSFITLFFCTFLAQVRTPLKPLAGRGEPHRDRASSR